MCGELDVFLIKLNYLIDISITSIQNIIVGFGLNNFNQLGVDNKEVRIVGEQIIQNNCAIYK
jgi:hypothetical protein